MPKPKVQTIPSWSYSRYMDYEQCPFKAKCKIIDKLREPSSATLANGTRVHAIAQVFASRKLQLDRDTIHLKDELVQIAKSKEIPEPLATFDEEFQMLRKQKSLQTEAEWAFDREWQPTDWFSQAAWLRIKVDAFFIENGKKDTTVVIIDHKTGKIHDDHKLQRSLYALGAFLMFPDAKKARASHWYLDLGQEKTEEWIVTQLEALKATWLDKTTAMLNDKTFAPRPGGYCKWCTFQKAKGGPCEF